MSTAATLPCFSDMQSVASECGLEMDDEVLAILVSLVSPPHNVKPSAVVELLRELKRRLIYR